jgi:hypothetical protein
MGMGMGRVCYVARKEWNGVYWIGKQSSSGLITGKPIIALWSLVTTLMWW